MLMSNAKRKIAFISSFIPRRCGIATFTSDLIDSMRISGGADFEPTVIAMQSEPAIQYARPVKFKIRRDVRSDYIAAANYINYSDIDAVSIQHEFGLFGGLAGGYLNLLLQRLNKPVITTLHTVLKNPSHEYYDSMLDICQASEKLVVINRQGIQILEDIYGVSPHTIELICHGVPDLPFGDTKDYKDSLGMTGRKVILTFGLLSKNKGIEVMLRALPEIVKADPSVLYVILGGTHPEVLRQEGQSYKCQLEKMITDSGMQNNVFLHNHYVSNEELFRFLLAADIYVTPYLCEEQLSSGTLAFAVGAGKAVVSTPYWAAQELLAQDRGRLVRFGDHKHMSDTIVEIIKDESLFMGLRKRAYDYGRAMTWPRIGKIYWKLFEGCSKPMPLSISANLIDSKTSSYNQSRTYLSS